MAEADRKGHMDGCTCLACMSRDTTPSKVEELLEPPPPLSRYRFGVCTEDQPRGAHSLQDITKSLIKLLKRKGSESDESVLEPGLVVSLVLPVDSRVLKLVVLLRLGWCRSKKSI